MGFQPQAHAGKRMGLTRNLFWLLTAALSLSHGQGTSPVQPNFIVIMTDDQGYADIGAFGSGSAPAGAPWQPWDRTPIRTPNLDRMAAEGARFTDFYVAANVCSPSRSALLTGSYPRRNGLHKILFPGDSIGLNPNEVTLADMLKRKNYATACIGKWHLGHKPRFLPTRQGFDYYYGLPYSNDMGIDKAATFAPDAVFRAGWTLEKIRNTAPDALSRGIPPLMRGEQIIEFPADQATLTSRYTNEAMRFVAQQAKASRPFFLFLPHTMPHTPLHPSPEFAGKSARGPYGDVIEELDHHTGRLLDTLKALGIDRNTLVIYTSDNGPWRIKGEMGGSAYPLREGKFSTWEGGQRVPCIMRWPGRIPAGLVQSEVASTIDLLPTFARLAGVPFPRNGETVSGLPLVLDGVDIQDLMFGKAGATRGAPFFYGMDGVRQGDWKLRQGALYNLKTDIHEDSDVGQQYPEKKAELERLINAFKNSLVARPTGEPSTPDPRAGCTDPSAINFDSDARRDDSSCRYRPATARFPSAQPSLTRAAKRGAGTSEVRFGKPGKPGLYNAGGRNAGGRSDAGNAEAVPYQK